MMLVLLPLSYRPNARGGGLRRPRKGCVLQQYCCSRLLRVRVIFMDIATVCRLLSIHVSSLLFALPEWGEALWLRNIAFRSTTGCPVHRQMYIPAYASNCVCTISSYAMYPVNIPGMYVCINPQRLSTSYGHPPHLAMAVHCTCRMSTSGSSSSSPVPSNPTLTARTNLCPHDV